VSVETEELSEEPSLDDLTGPYYVAWWITNRCNLLCVHCINDSGPFHQFDNELAGDEIERVARQIVELGVPQGSITGGEPLIHKDFFKVAGYLSDNGVSLNVETDAQLINRETARRIARLNLRAMQVSVDGATQSTYGLMRRTTTGSAELSRVLDAIRMLAEEGVRVSVNFVPTRFSANEVGQVIDAVAALGAKTFYTGRIMRVGRAAMNWKWLAPTEAQYQGFFATLNQKAKEYSGRVRIIYYPYTVTHELKFRTENPAASFVILPNGKVKMIASMPFLCADLRRHSLAEAWERYKIAWKHPMVREFSEKVKDDDPMLASNNSFVELDLEQPVIQSKV